MPTLTWDESWLGGERYALSVSGNLRDAEQLVFRLNGDSELRTVRQQDDQRFSVKLAGEGTPNGPLTLGAMVWAVVPSSTVEQQVDIFSIGSQEQASFALFLQGLSAGSLPDIENSATIERRFTQTVEGRRTVLRTEVPESLYDYYKSRKRTRDWGGYVSAGLDDPYIGSITDDLQAFADRNGLSDREVVNQAVGFVQQMEYTQDKAATGYNEYPKYPIETLVDRGGDCEDSCILLSQMLQNLGYGTVLLVIPQAQHMALGVKGDESIQGTYYEYEGSRYYYLETTAGGWEVGEIPENVRQAGGSAQIEEVNSRPVLAHQWAVEVPSEGGARVTARVHNTGAAPTQTAEVEMRFETRAGSVVASDRQSASRISPASAQDVVMSLRPPDTEEVRGRLRVFLDRELHDESTSEFREPLSQD